MHQYDLTVGVDVGKFFHWIHAIDASGTVVFDQQVDQHEQQLSAVFAGFAACHQSVLVVVDQPKNIGRLTLACAARAGFDTRYLPGLAMRRAAGLLPGDAKTDARDAKVIALCTQRMPEALRPAPTPDVDRARLEALAAYDHDCCSDRTRQINRLHALLAETNPTVEQVIGEAISSEFVLKLLAKYGGPWAMRAAGRTQVTRWAAKQSRHPKELLTKILDAAWATDHQPPGTDIREQVIAQIANHIIQLTGQRKTIQQAINAILENDPTYQALRTMPGVGPATAATLVTLVDIDRFPDHEKLASYAGLVARTQQSGTTIKGETASRAGNKTLKNALFQSAYASLRWDPKARTFYDTKKAAGKRHATILIALARKRLKIMHAIMRNKTPYQP